MYQSHFEPGHFSGPLVYQECGHVFLASFNSTPENGGNYPGKCPSCLEPPVNPEWAEKGKYCKAKRHAAFDFDNQRFCLGSVAEALGIHKADLFSMEHGRLDPQPLIDFWQEQEKIK